MDCQEGVYPTQPESSQPFSAQYPLPVLFQLVYQQPPLTFVPAHQLVFVHQTFPSQTPITPRLVAAHPRTSPSQILVLPAHFSSSALAPTTASQPQSGLCHLRHNTR